MTDEYPAPFAQTVIAADDSTPDVVELPIQGAIGVVTLEAWRSARPFIAIDGTRRGLGTTTKVPLANGGVVKVRIKSRLAGKPRVYADGIEVFTTPQVPIGLLLLILLPVLSLLLIRGLIGFAIAFGGVAVAQHIARQDSWSIKKRLLSLLGIAVATWAVAYGVAVLWVMYVLD